MSKEASKAGRKISPESPWLIVGIYIINNKRSDIYSDTDSDTLPTSNHATHGIITGLYFIENVCGKCRASCDRMLASYWLVAG
jgi:hypothetical protein